MLSKYTSSDSADYAYAYGGKLSYLSSDFPGEGTIYYGYGGDGKLRERDVVGGDYDWYNYDAGWNWINTEDDEGALAKSFISRSQVALGNASVSNAACWVSLTRAEGNPLSPHGPLSFDFRPVRTAIVSAHPHSLA